MPTRRRARPSGEHPPRGTEEEEECEEFATEAVLEERRTFIGREDLTLDLGDCLEPLDAAHVGRVEPRTRLRRVCFLHVFYFDGAQEVSSRTWFPRPLGVLGSLRMVRMLSRMEFGWHRT